MLRALARLLLRVTGWRVEGEPPEEPRYVMLAAPHTSNWDLVWMLAIGMVLGVRVSWMGKDGIFKPPFGALMRRLGGIPIRRSGPHHVVDQMIARFAAADRLVLAVPPAGTRGYTPYWKSGFYHIALGAGVPVVPGYLDYGTRTGGMGPAVHLSGDVRADMDVLRAFYADKKGRRPEWKSEVRLREEDPA